MQITYPSSRGKLVDITPSVISKDELSAGDRLNILVHPKAPERLDRLPASSDLPEALTLLATAVCGGFGYGYYKALKAQEKQNEAANS
ncbi:hypothetical protein [Mangrovicella endophytica]|uniref:hypothetical protein n=1 Tax=Mangrovicella endophytica TaxID=2066697 RepID=UPI0012FFE0F8|nr:hypothetical protein [Mangrovicella endophytica]